MPAKNSGIRFYVFYDNSGKAQFNRGEDADAFATLMSKTHGEVSLWSKVRILNRYRDGLMVAGWIDGRWMGEEPAQ